MVESSLNSSELQYEIDGEWMNESGNQFANPMDDIFAIHSDHFLGVADENLLLLDSLTF
jgi:hypothetical protein